MTDPLFPGFETGFAEAEDARIYWRAGGSGAPLLLLHGYPQTGAMWARVAGRLAGRFRVIVPDLRGYGRSSGPVGVEAMSKRAMGADMIALMRAQGFERFALAGHDRGGRVAYRLALDHPERLSKIAVLDISPTDEYWAKFDRAFGMAIYHWTFLAQPYPLPETLIGGAPDWYMDYTLASWTAKKDLSAFDPAALTEYRANARAAATLRAMCDDYRAGAGIDAEQDAADRAAGRKIAVPLLALWGGVGLAQAASTPLDVWRRWAERVEGAPVAQSGHFIPEEAPEETAAALRAFFDG